MVEENKKLDYHEEKKEEIKSYGWGIRHLQVACMMVNMTCLVIARSCIGVAVLAMSDTKHPNSTVVEVFDWDKKTQSIILSSFFWGYSVMQIPAGMLAKKFGGKPTISFALFANGLLFILVPLCASWGGWLFVCASRVAMGATQSFLLPGTFTLLGQWLPISETTNFTGIVFGGTKMGAILGAALSGILVDSAYGWKSIFYTIAAILLVNLVIWHFLGASSPREHRWLSEEERKFIEAGHNIAKSKRPPTPWKCILRSIPVMAIVFPNIGFAIVVVFFMGDLPTFLEKGLGISLKSSAMLSVLPYIGMWLGNMASGYISEKILIRNLLKKSTTRKLFQTIALFGTAAGLVFLSFLGPEQKTTAIITLISCLTCLGCTTAGYVVNQLDLSPNFAGVVMSILNCCATMGAVVIPLLTALILQNDPTNVGRWQIVFLLIAGICVVCNVVYLVFGTTDRQPWDDPNYLDKKLANTDHELQTALVKKEADQNVRVKN